ncbi:MAG: hypothetical protein E7604_07250 [Ruminococcaceae bacterium]|nr:hypothetical protein [Oscillospiraceae bacterium]
MKDTIAFVYESFLSWGIEADFERDFIAGKIVAENNESLKTRVKIYFHAFTSINQKISGDGVTGLFHKPRQSPDEIAK